GLNVEKFDADRRSSEVRNAVDAAFQLAIRAGVAASPTLLVGTELHQGVPVEQQLATWESSKTA
ncbi:MAG: hypothetical protein NTX07_05725, partial [Solirubrobacterales bacterium]|nr:hypothetical protein [Solirubrobacterales bacterium]